MRLPTLKNKAAAGRKKERKGINDSENYLEGDDRWLPLP